MHGESSDLTSSGVYGHNSAGGYGIAGRSETGVGVLGDTQSGNGVQGITRAANHSGVYGTNTTGNCCAGYFDGPVQVNGNLKVNGSITSNQGGAWIASTNGAVGVIDDRKRYELTHLDLPAGSYAVTAKAGMYDVDTALSVECFLSGPAGDLDESDPADYDGGGLRELPIALVGTIALPSPGRLTLRCATGGPGVVGHGSKIVAVSVDNLHCNPVSLMREDG